MIKPAESINKEVFMRSKVGNSRAIQVVVVDDEPDYRYLMRAVLERGGGFEVVGEAGDGVTGLEMVLMHEPRLVLLDISMPIMDGFQVLPIIRDLCPTSTLVILSGSPADSPHEKATKSMKAHALALGADAYIQKGQRLEELMSEFRIAISRHSDGDV